MQTIQEQLKNGKLSRIHLLYGEEQYMVRYYKNLLKDKLSQPDDTMNVASFYGNQIRPSEIDDVAQILPFLANNRLIIIQSSGFFKNASDMADYIAGFPDTTYVIFSEQEVDKRNRLYKWVNKNGCVTECKKQNESMLSKWIAGYLKRDNKKITVEAVHTLIERVGTDMEILTGELEKLISYVGEREQIDIKDINAISSGITVSHIFDMIDAVAQKEQQKAMRLYSELVENKESPMSILYLFSRHINILMQMKELMKSGCSNADMARAIGIPPFTIKKYAAQAKLFKMKKLRTVMEDRADLEEQFKNGKIDDQLAVELFLIQALTKS